MVWTFSTVLFGDSRIVHAIAGYVLSRVVDRVGPFEFRSLDQAGPFAVDHPYVRFRLYVAMSSFPGFSDSNQS